MKLSIKRLGLLSAIIFGLICMPLYARQADGDDLSSRIARLPVEKVLDLALKLLDTPVAGHEDEIQSYYLILFTWATETDQFVFSLHEESLPLLETSDGISPYLSGAYMAAELFSLVGNGLTETNFKTFREAFKHVLEYYKANKAAIGDVPDLDRLLSLSPSELDKALKNFY